MSNYLKESSKKKLFSPFALNNFIKKKRKNTEGSQFVTIGFSRDFLKNIFY